MTVTESSPIVIQLPARPLTLDDVTVLAAADDVHRYELDAGSLLIMPPPDVEHAAILTRLIAWFVAARYEPERVLATPGVRISGHTSGRSPDLAVLRRAVPGTTVWIDPGDVLLAVEIVSPGSETVDRIVKPLEYAAAGIPNFWRIERADGSVTVQMFMLGIDEHGAPSYPGASADPLSVVLSGPPPPLR